MKNFILESCGEEIEMVEIEIEKGHFIQMTKAHYDELEAAKENGTIS
jgi:hypothetical protein